MNRQLWKCVKYGGTLMLLTVFVFQILYYNTAHVNSAPREKHIPQHKGQPSKQLSKQDAQSRLPTESVIRDATPIVSRDQPTLYSDILLKTPQQSFDYFRDLPNNTASIWPSDQKSRHDDRILNQLMWKTADENLEEKVILIYTGLDSGMKHGRQGFIDYKCPVSACFLTSDHNQMSKASLVLWMNHMTMPAQSRPMGQIWAVFLLESPYHTQSLNFLNGHVNWTTTYRRDSTIVAPYERYTPFNLNELTKPQTKDYSAGKTKMVAWFVSRCEARNNRMGYARALQEHVGVDIYGSCGELSCTRSRANDCFSMLSKDYRFYLAFENSNCRDYITEKFFVNGLSNDVIPIVLGAHPDDYRAAAPPHSYIHVDDFESPKDLAVYLQELANDPDKYNEYFQWKGAGSNINTHFACRLCSMLHKAQSDGISHVYEDLDKWWRGPDVCQDKQASELWPRW